MEVAVAAAVRMNKKDNRFILLMELKSMEWGETRCVTLQKQKENDEKVGKVQTFYTLLFRKTRFPSLCQFCWNLSLFLESCDFQSLNPLIPLVTFSLSFFTSAFIILLVLS